MKELSILFERLSCLRTENFEHRKFFAKFWIKICKTGQEIFSSLIYKNIWFFFIFASHISRIPDSLRKN